MLNPTDYNYLQHFSIGNMWMMERARLEGRGPEVRTPKKCWVRKTPSKPCQFFTAKILLIVHHLQTPYFTHLYFMQYIYISRGIIIITIILLLNIQQQLINIQYIECKGLQSDMDRDIDDIIHKLSHPNTLDTLNTNVSCNANAACPKL